MSNILQSASEISIRAIEAIRSSIKNEKALNPNCSLEPRHILFYYRADCLALECRCSGLRQVTKTDKVPIKNIRC